MDRMKVDAELIHNWPHRYAGITTGLLGELSDSIRSALMRAFKAHNNNGRNAQELAEELAARYPDELYC